MSRNKKAMTVSQHLGVGYAQALRYVRQVIGECDGIPDLIHACRELHEKERSVRKDLRKGSGAVDE